MPRVFGSTIACLVLAIPLMGWFTSPGGVCADETADSPAKQKLPRIAAVVTEYRHNSHADVIVSQLMQTKTLDGKGEFPKLQLVSLYTDQVPKNDTSRQLAKEHGVPIFDTIEGALTLGTGKLAVDGILLIAEHGQYPKSDTGQTIYPKKRLFAEVRKVFESSGRVVPVFHDKHVADNWADAKEIYDATQRLKIPFMAGSSLPGLWRYPPANTKRGAKLKEIVAVSYGSLDAYGFHALEMVQCLAERRQGGETGIKSVYCLEDDAVWEAGKRGVYDQELLRAALSRQKARPISPDQDMRELVPHPVLFVIDYQDGLRASVLQLNPALQGWSVAWREADSDEITSTLFWTQEARPFAHFNFLLEGAEKMFHTGQPTWPAERTLITSGALDALLISKKQGGKPVETPYLDIDYKTDWDWKQPRNPPPGRPIMSQ